MNEFSVDIVGSTGVRVCVCGGGWGGRFRWAVIG